MAFKTRTKLKTLFAALGLLAVSLILLTRPVVLRAVGHWLNSGQFPAPADYAMVLPGGSETRPFVAAALYRQGWVKGILIPENKITPAIADGTESLHHEILTRILTARGVDPAHITLLPGRSDSTLHDLQALDRFLDRNPQSRVLVITDEFHTRRTGWLLAKALGEKAGKVGLVAAPHEEWDPKRWWQYKQGLILGFNEYLKLAYYLLALNPAISFLFTLLILALLAAILHLLRSRPLRPSAPTPALHPQSTP